jgi:hypothetical protein
MSIDPYADEREEDKDSPFNQGNKNDQNHGVLSPEQKDKNKQNDQNRRQEQRRKEKRMAGSDEFNKQISRSGLQDETLKGKYTQRELRAEMQSGNMTAKDAQELQDSGMKFTGKAQDFLQKKFDMNFAKNGGSAGSNNGTGDNNGGGGNGGNGNGSGSNGQTHAQNAIDAAAANNPIDHKLLNREIHESPLYQYAKGDLMNARIFGDMWSSGYGGTWSRGSRDRDNDDD